jgi:3',5'-cyclic AMP phosphodiesterase CpdA
VVERGRKLEGMIDTNGAAEAAVKHLTALVPRPDVVLVTGDLADHGAANEYALLREFLDRLPMPYFVIPGNHDRRAPLLDVFAPSRASSSPGGFVQYAVDDFPLRMIALDTLLEGRDDGSLCDTRLEWLDKTLAIEPERPTLIFMHHPPFETGIWWMDSGGLNGAVALRHTVARHPQVKRIVCGHVHRPIQTAWDGVVVSIAPSTSHQVYLDLVPESPPQAVIEPTACHLHVFTGGESITHTSYINWPQKPIDLSVYLGDWESLKVEMRARKAALR